MDKEYFKELSAMDQTKLLMGMTKTMTPAEFGVYLGWCKRGILLISYRYYTLEEYLRWYNPALVNTFLRWKQKNKC